MAQNYEILEVKLDDRKLLERYIRVPWYIHRDYAPNDHWVPPLLMDRRDYLNPKKNPFFEHAEVGLWILRRDGRDIGRIAAVVDRDYIAFHNEQTGYFGMFECPDEPDLARALLRAAATWLKERGMTKFIGPLELSTNYISGALVEGFDRDPGINMAYNPPYYDSLLKSCGLQTARDLLYWGLDPQKPVPERIVKISRRIAERKGVTIRKMSFKDWDNEVLRTLEIYNDAWEKNWGFVPVGKKEYLHIAKDLKMVLHPDLAIIAEVKGEPVAFVLTVSDVNPILKKVDGKLFPFGIFRLAWDVMVRPKITGGRLILLGIKSPYRGLGIDSLLFVETHAGAQKLGWTSGQIGWTLEDNVKVNRAIEAMGGYQISKFRVYEHELDD